MAHTSGHVGVGLYVSATSNPNDWYHAAFASVAVKRKQPTCSSSALSRVGCSNDVPMPRRWCEGSTPMARKSSAARSPGGGRGWRLGRAGLRAWLRSPREGRATQGAAAALDGLGKSDTPQAATTPPRRRHCLCRVPRAVHRGGPRRPNRRACNAAIPVAGSPHGGGDARSRETSRKRAPWRAPLLGPCSRSSFWRREIARIGHSAGVRLDA